MCTNGLYSYRIYIAFLRILLKEVLFVMRKYVLFFILTILIGLIYVSNDYSTSSADTNSAIASAPEGIDIDKYFYPVTQPSPYGEHNPFKTNSASIKNNYILDLADGYSTYGASWGRDDIKNYIDLRYPQTISAWLYFGSDQGSDVFNGQGMALVLQNDSRKQAALGAGGQALGVDGYDRSTKTQANGSGLIDYYTTKFDDPTTIAKSAIQNSLAIEFDTQKNDVTNSQGDAPTAFQTYSTGSIWRYPFIVYQHADYSLNAFDTVDTSIAAPSDFPDNTLLGAYSGQFGHISFTFPSNPNSYHLTNLVTGTSNSDTYSPFTKTYSLFHTENTTASLIDGTDSHNQNVDWHHMTFTWTPPKAGSTIGKATYYFNDKDKDGTLNPVNTGGQFNKSISHSVDVNTDIFHLASGQHTVLWGFTGANSDKPSPKETRIVASKLVDFESIPSLVEAHATSSIFDQNLNKTITEDSTDKTVLGGDKVALNYQLNYDKGNADWNNIKAHFNLPEHFKLTPDAQDNIGTITYANGMIEGIPASSLATDKTYISYTLRSPLNTNDSTAKITLNGTVNNTTGKDLDIIKQPAKFVGDTNISSTETPSFIIKYNPTWSMSLKPLTDKNLLFKQENATLDINPELTYSDKHDFYDSDKIKYTFKVGSHIFTKELPSNSNSDTSENTIDLRELIDNDASKVDFWSLFPSQTDVPVTVFVTDKDNISTSPQTFTVHVLQNKILQIRTSKNIEFSDTNIFDTNKILHRKTNFILEITSFREPWSLSVSTTPLKNGEEFFNGSPVFIDQQNSIHPLTDAPTFVTDDQTSHDPIKVDDISQKWNNNSGILLKQSGNSKMGKYTGTLTWTASDIVKNS